MKTLRISLLVSALVFVSGTAFAMAPAVKTDMPSSKSSCGCTFATVDIAQIIDPKNPADSKAEGWKESFKTLTDSLDKEQKALQKLQSDVEEAYKKLEEKQKKGEQPTKEETAKIQTMFQELQTKNQQLSEKAQAQFVQLQNDFKSKIDAAVKVVADKKGYDLVMYKDIVLHAKNVVDMTPDVLVELNAKHAAEKRAKKMTSEAPKAAVKSTAAKAA